MSNHDAFALKNSGLNPFLFAGVGEETNGSPLTILSILARLGEDPWAKAANWSRMPRATAIDALAESIGRMPLVPRALAEARATATRLVLLLPARIKAPERKAAATAATGASLPTWLPMAALFCSLALAFATSMLTPKSPAGDAKPIAPTTQSSH